MQIFRKYSTYGWKLCRGLRKRIGRLLLRTEKFRINFFFSRKNSQWNYLSSWAIYILCTCSIYLYIYICTYVYKKHCFLNVFLDFIVLPIVFPLFNFVLLFRYCLFPSDKIIKYIYIYLLHIYICISIYR